ncbi:MAG: proton-conducting transporter membrane subunit [Pseudomonadota bacterium]|nr:proton-conducting transporter membrane subunit [Pseudomonadota bacterium]
MIALVPLLPLLAAAWIGVGMLGGWNRGESGERSTARIAVWGALLALLLLLGLDLVALIRGAPGQVVLGDWITSGDYRVRISFTLDPLGLSLATLVALLCLLTLRFSVNYLHREAGFQRFFMVMSLFTGAMLLIVTAGNAVLTFAGWELAGVSSYLLIAYAYERPMAGINATRAFVTNRIGDAGFVLGIALAFMWLEGVEWPQLAGSHPDTLTAGLIGFGFLLAALAKSAQVPFSPWIARALEGPTPSSAVFYGAVMVHAGVYLALRLQPLLEQAPLLMATMTALGFATALYGWLSGLVQTDVKSSLMFSTIAQVGLMFLECGLGWFTLAAWHLALHAMLRAYQFLHAPALVQAAKQPARPAPAWLRRRPGLYTAAMMRFWLDPLADWLLAHPTRELAQDLQDFDQRVVNRMVGLPSQGDAVASLAEREAQKQGRVVMDGDIGRGRGVVGRFMEWVAARLHWFEEHLVLRGGGEGLKNAIDLVGGYLIHVEQLLSQPRYLLLIVTVTFVVIL